MTITHRGSEIATNSTAKPMLAARHAVVHLREARTVGAINEKTTATSMNANASTYASEWISN
jgi:hypothetical protein